EEQGTDTVRNRVEAAARAASLCLDELLADNSVALEGATIIDAFDRRFVFVAVHGLGGREAQLLTGTCEIRESTERSAVVVVVDDDPGYLKALVLTIERSDLDVEVVEAATGVDALLEIGRVQPSLIVLDYSLPDLNAPEVIRRLLEPGRRLDAEVMVVTGGMPDQAAVALRQMGVKVILNKAAGMP